MELDLSNHTTNLKNATGVDTSKPAKKIEIANFKWNVDKLVINKLKNVPTNLSHLKKKLDKLDVDKLINVPVNLSKLIDVVKNDAVKKDVSNANIKNIEDKIPDITNLGTTTVLNAKLNKIKNEKPTFSHKIFETNSNFRVK